MYQVIEVKMRVSAEKETSRLIEIGAGLPLISVNVRFLLFSSGGGSGLAQSGGNKEI